MIEVSRFSFGPSGGAVDEHDLVSQPLHENGIGDRRTYMPDSNDGDLYHFFLNDCKAFP
jgi:hypothetical protein